MNVQFYSPEHFESVVDLLCDMSVHYNGANASDRDVVCENLKQNILGPDSGVKVVVAVDHRRVVGMACISLLYPAPKERGQLFMKELYVVGDRRRNGIGLELMRFVAAYAVRKSCSRFDWTVDETNPKAAELLSRAWRNTNYEQSIFSFRGQRSFGIRVWNVGAISK